VPLLILPASGYELHNFGVLKMAIHLWAEPASDTNPVPVKNVTDTDTALYAAEILIAATTEAATYNLFVPQGLIVTITAYGLAGAETIAVEIYTPAGYVQYKTGGTSVALSVDDNSIGFDIPGRYRLNKGVTAGAAGVLRDQA
jgi:hypothetical protein